MLSIARFGATGIASTCTFLTLFLTDCCAGLKEAHYVVVRQSDSIDFAVQLGTPSVNDQGDIVVRGRRTSTASTYNAYRYNTAAKTYTPILVRSGQVMSPFPVIANRATGSSDPGDIVGFNSTSAAVSIVQRFDYSGGAYISTPIARANLESPPLNEPFDFLLSSVGVDASNRAYFVGDKHNSTGNDIYRANSETTSSNYVPLAGLHAGFSAIDAYVSASENGQFVYRGTGSSGSGIYANSAQSAIATTANGFGSTGSRPSVNDLGTVGFYGDSPGMSGVLLRYSDGTIAHASQTGATSTVDSFAKVAINDYNQVAYLGTNQNGDSAIFSTNLGATREIVAVGDVIDGSPVIGLNLYDGLMKNGQLIYLATLSNGSARVIRTNRGYSQTALNDSPVVVPWSVTGYLRKAQGEFGGPTAGSIGKYGCNLTSTANILSYFGHNTTPAELQDWLLSKFNSATSSQKSHYISPSNDFVESIVTEFSQERVSQGLASSFVTWEPIPSTGPGSNFANIVSELRAHRPVKLRVPSHTGVNYKPGGHYVMIYGLVDRTKLDGAITKDDLLIHDPGNGGVNTLGDYERKFNYQISHPNWLDEPVSPENTIRINRYFESLSAPAPQLNIQVHSPVEVFIVAPNGQRLGSDPAAGSYAEISGGLYWHDETFYSLDEGGAPEPAWEDPEDSIKRLFVPSPETGQYSLHVIGTGTGSFEISLGGEGGFEASSSSITGFITPGQRFTYDFAGSMTPGMTIPGDFDLDDDVDGIDFLKWQRGESPDPLSSDDLADWKTNYGTEPDPLANVGTTIPEPGSMVLVMLAMLGSYERRIALGVRNRSSE